jgi:hypothetical protein
MAASLEIRLTGGAANSDPDASLGGTMSSETISATALNNLFDNVSAAEASSGDTEYRAIDVYNAGDATAKSVQAWISTESPSDDSEIEFGKDDTATQELSDESTAPDSPAVNFSHHTSASKCDIDDIAAGSAQRLFLKRTISASAGNYADDGITLCVQYA